MDGATALERAYGHLTTTVGKVPADGLSTASACAGWDLRDLLNHVLGAGWMFTKANQGETGVLEDAGDLVRDDHVTACADLAAANVAAWRTPDALVGERSYPFGTFPAPVALMLNVGEIAVHAWDVAKATGQPATIDPEVAGLLLDFYQGMPLDGFREHGAFGPEVPVDESAPVADRMLGLLGFQP
ncbi:MAG: TIGR03086 family metal-binding protein [Actinomycetota bacterium]|nr:TIGR03086 family metal-binding protein [Actinomycetota bacterium]